MLKSDHSIYILDKMFKPVAEGESAKILDFEGIVGDNIYIGVNATIVGKVHIGNDVLIGPNSFVNFDVPDHSVVIGNPGVIHHKEHATNGYVNYLI
jgi:serine acetyltransferase